jgi:hypothetical protein
MGLGQNPITYPQAARQESRIVMGALVLSHVRDSSIFTLSLSSMFK